MFANLSNSRGDVGRAPSSAAGSIEHRNVLQGVVGERLAEMLESVNCRLQAPVGSRDKS